MPARQPAGLVPRRPAALPHLLGAYTSSTCMGAAPSPAAGPSAAAA